MKISLDEQQHATIIAALNYWLEKGQTDPANRDDWMHDLATNGDTQISLDREGVDELILHLNCDEEAVGASPLDPAADLALSATLDGLYAEGIFVDVADRRDGHYGDGGPPPTDPSDA